VRRARLLLAALLACASVAAQAADGAGGAAGARPLQRWAEGVFRWHYSRAAEPAWLERGLGLSLFEWAARQWAGCALRIEFAGTLERAAAPGDGVSTLGWSRALAPRMRGLTLRRGARHSLLEADVAISATNAQLRGSPELLRKVVLHEFGHALGLVHSADCRDVMSLGAHCPAVPFAALPQRPTAGDLAQCALRYGQAPAPRPAE